MDVATAIDLVGDLVPPPGVAIEATDYTHRYQDAIRLTITLTDAHASERHYAPDYPVLVEGGARANFVVPVGGLADVADLVGEVLDRLAEVRSHEDREFVRVGTTHWAPFHPHRTDGIARWAARTGGDPHRDYFYGTA